jgi:hypothetical protein
LTDVTVQYEPYGFRMRLQMKLRVYVLVRVASSEGRRAMLPPGKVRER